MAAANEGKILVVVDVAELAHKPMPARSPAGDHPITATLKARVEALQAELAKVEAWVAGHRADFERERERTGSWRSYCGRRPTRSQPRKRWPGWRSELAGLERGRGGVRSRGGQELDDRRRDRAYHGKACHGCLLIAETRACGAP